MAGAGTTRASSADECEIAKPAPIAINRPAARRPERARILVEFLVGLVMGAPDIGEGECLRRGRWFEFQGNAIHAIAQAGRLGSIIEDMTQVTAASPAMNRRPDHAVGCVFGRADGIVQRRPEAWPAGAAVEFRG